MVGIGETYLPAFVLALSGSQLACGLVSTLPLVVGAVLQLASPWLLRTCGSYRRCVALSAALQAATFVPLLAAALTGRMGMLAVFALVSVYWATGLAANGPWNAWIETLVPAPLRTRYFAGRSRINQWGIVAGYLAGGIALQAADRVGVTVAVFAVLFSLAAVSRLVSVTLLTMHREPQPPRRTPAVSFAARCPPWSRAPTAACSFISWRHRLRCKSPGRISIRSCSASCTFATRFTP